MPEAPGTQAGSSRPYPVRSSLQRPLLLLPLLIGLLLWLSNNFTPGSSALPLTATPSPSATLAAYCQGVYHGDTSLNLRRIDQYPCRPDWPETGPEQLYSFQPTAAGPITITLSHPPLPNLDLDLFLLEETNPTHCYAADASLHLTSLAPGSYLIAIDSFGGDGGPFTLEVDCDSLPLATATSTATPQPTPTATPTPTITPTRSKSHTTATYPPSSNRIPFPPPSPPPSSCKQAQTATTVSSTHRSALGIFPPLMLM